MKSEILELKRFFYGDSIPRKISCEVCIRKRTFQVISD
jgi:hypothetical protein